MKQTTEERLATLYNLILNPQTRDWERQQLEVARQRLNRNERLSDVLDQLEATLRPLATRHSLTPNVAEFYDSLTKHATAHPLDSQLHFAKDEPFIERAVFAGGCFWCMVEPFEVRPGILAVYSGYTGGTTANPSYEDVAGGWTGHVEAVEIIFDCRVLSYEQLLEIYWRLIDPTDAHGQINDRGQRYRPIIFYQDERQHQLAKQSMRAMQLAGIYQRPIVVKIEQATTFWLAENYHQQFYKKEKQRYRRMERARKQYLFFLRLQQKFSRWFRR